MEALMKMRALMLPILVEQCCSTISSAAAHCINFHHVKKTNEISQAKLPMVLNGNCTPGRARSVFKTFCPH